MKLLIAAPPNLTPISHLEQALSDSKVQPDEILVPETPLGSTDAWIRSWAQSRGCKTRPFGATDEALKVLSRGGQAAIVAVISPDHHDTHDLVAKAESLRIPIFIYRELYRQDPRVNCRFSPVERPDVWLRALTAEQRDFFRRLHALCQQHDVTLKTAPEGQGGTMLAFADGTQFEDVELNSEACRVRPRGSIRYRRIRLD